MYPGASLAAMSSVPSSIDSAPPSGGAASPGRAGLAISDAYDPERFRRDGHAVIDMLANALARAQARTGVVLPWHAPEAARSEWGEAPLTAGSGELVADLARFVERSTQLAHPQCMAHQVPPQRSSTTAWRSTRWARPRCRSSSR